MVKYNKKFFFGENSKSKTPKFKEKKPKDKRSNRKGISFYGEKINYFFKSWLIVIILIVFIVILVLFVRGCSNNDKQKNARTPNQINSSEPIIIDSITLNLNEEVPTIDKFVKNYDRVKTETDIITYDENNLVNNKYNVVGSYKVNITIDNKTYTSRIVVVDKEPPVFAVKDVTITEGEFYTINDFVTSCSDNSGKECAISYEKPEYGKATSPGTYTIAIIASDLSGNTAEVQRAKLVIKAKQTTPTPKPNTKNCQYGSTSYTSDHVITYSVIKNNCPVDGNYAKTDTYITTPFKTAQDDLEKLKKEIEAKNISMKIKFDLTVIPILNNEKTGLIGYAAYISGTNTATNKVVVSYDINPNGTRKYTINELGL